MLQYIWTDDGDWVDFVTYVTYVIDLCDSFMFSLDAVGLKDVYLDIEPRIVRRGESATLRCSYDLESDPLYSVKLYRGNHEFYRITPKEHPSTKIFPFTGVHVDVSIKWLDVSLIV